MKHLQNLTNWFERDGDNTLALDWPVDALSLVWEIGGYEGRWTSQMLDKYKCYMEVFEPQDWAFEKLKARFEEEPSVLLHPYGLWIQDEAMVLGDFYTDGASVLKRGEQISAFGPAMFKDIRYEMAHVENIDVCLMNIEGAEWDLIPYMIETMQMSKIANFWCQFHPGLILGPEQRAESIFIKMEDTHDLLWNCYPTAVAWRRKNDSKTMDLSGSLFAQPVLEMV